MKEIKLKIDNKEHVSNIPESWDEVSVDHYQKLVVVDRIEWDSHFDKDVAVLSTFIGVDKEIIELMEIEEFNELIDALSFLKEKIEFPPLGETIELDGKIWFIKSDFDKMNVGERITLDVFLNGKKSPDIDLDLFLTLFIKESADEMWRNDHKERKDLFKKLPFVKVKSVMDFFLTGMLSRKKDTKHSLEDPEKKVVKKNKLKKEV